MNTKAQRAAATLLTLLAIGGGGMPAPASSRTSHLKTPPGSYLQYQVYTVDQLIRQVQENPVVLQRFARHFQIPESRVVSYMRANLVASWVPRTGRYTVYCVSRSGKFYPIHQVFRKGTKVFALRNGQPVMKWLCGNPLSKFLPAVQTRTIVRRPPPVIAKVSPEIQELVPAETEDVQVPNEAPPAGTINTIFPAAAGIPAIALASSGGGVNLAPLALLPIAGFFIGNGSGGGNSGGNTPGTLPIVPEPSPTVYLLAALPFIALRMARSGRGTKRVGRRS